LAKLSFAFTFFERILYQLALTQSAVSQPGKINPFTMHVEANSPPYKLPKLKAEFIAL